jgi:hypothetical protein
MTGVFQPSHCRGLLYDAIHGRMTGRMTGWMTGWMDGWKASFRSFVFLCRLLAVMRTKS